VLESTGLEDPLALIASNPIIEVPDRPFEEAGPTGTTLSKDPSPPAAQRSDRSRHDASTEVVFQIESRIPARGVTVAIAQRDAGGRPPSGHSRNRCILLSLPQYAGGGPGWGFEPGKTRYHRGQRPTYSAGKRRAESRSASNLTLRILICI
jgi:hypothetical protein